MWNTFFMSRLYVNEYRLSTPKDVLTEQSH